MEPEHVSTTATIAAPAATVFAVLADPRTHADIDGTGRVLEPLDPAPLTAIGQVFRMDMYHPDHVNGRYRTANQIHVFDEPRAIGWRTGYETGGRLEFGGWFWRYDLDPSEPATTDVTLTYDWSAVPSRIREYIDFPPFGPDHFRSSLRHLGERAELAARDRP